MALPIRRYARLNIALLAIALAACSATPPLAQQPSAAPVPSATAAPSATRTPTVAPTPTAAPLPTPTFVPIEPTPTLAPLSLEQRQQVFEQFWSLVNDRYVYTDYRGLNWRAIHTEYIPKIEAAITPDAFYNLLAELTARLGDDHSVFLSPQDVAADNAAFDGTSRFGGIGVSVYDVAEGALITALAPNGPAAAAGIQLHEIITRIDGVDVVAEAKAGRNPLLRGRGEPGTTVQVTIRARDGREREMTLTRSVISSDDFPSVESQRLPNTQVGLLRINTFNTDNVDQKIHTNLEQLLDAGPLDGLIIDVRNNGGGRVDYLLNTCGFLLNGGDIGSDSGRETNETLVVPPGQTLPRLASVPIAILIDGESASAAEIFAAGMQSRGRAIIIGEPSSGNTEVVVPHTLGDGSELHLAERLYRRPDSTTIEGKGVQPDRLVPAEWWRFAPADDPQVQAALAALRSPAPLAPPTTPPMTQ